MSFENRIADPGTTIRLTVSFFKNGVLFDPFNISTVTIFDAPSGGNGVYNATPIKSSTGIYYIDYPIPGNTETGIFFYDEWTWIATETSGTKVQRYSFLTGTASGTGEIFSSEPSGGALTLELRIQALEKTTNEVVKALNKVAKRKEISYLSSIIELDLGNINTSIDSIVERLNALEN
jgi:hypothetical protein